ncbi:CPBP family intramembrane glutamic endopeptidase [Halomarina salina]|uniref:CPBP family intramembrane glutamic endopeptidase n=1 Tax=Halomarina salina TaxID=1872699 RepID=A0ABD5RHZ2_9EURY|nr:type II CAAX endopeptidase family protein [Halomarina salina]
MEPVSRGPDNRTRFWTVAKMAGLGFLGIIVGLLTAVVLVLLLSLAGVSVADRPFLNIVISLVAIQGVGLSIVGLAYLTFTGRGLSFLRARVPSLRDIAWVVGGVVAIFVLLFVVGIAITVINQMTGVEPAQNSVTELASQDPSVLLLLIPAAFLVIGPAEELLFRGIVQGRLREVFGPVGAIATASVIFGLGHATALTGGSGGLAAFAIPLAALSLLSVVFGVAYERTENLVVPILIHGAYDAVLFGLIYVVLTAGGDLGAAANNSSTLLAALG